MKHGTTNRRQRGRGNSPRRGGNQRMQVFDSNGPDVRIRGTAHQVQEKYVALAKDASSMGDIVLAESYLQHAEHYQRVINSWAAEETTSSPQSQNAKQGEQQKEAAKPQSNNKNKGQDDDLALPSSILGTPSDSVSQERTADASA